DELISLRDIVALDDLTLEGVIYAELLHGFHGSSAIGCRLRIGDRDLGELAVLERLLAELQAIALTEQNELACSVSEYAALDAVTFLDSLRRPRLIGCKKDLEGRGLRDLIVEAAGRAEAEHGLVAGRL